MRAITIYTFEPGKPAERFGRAMEMLGLTGLPVFFRSGCSPEECAGKTDGLILTGGADIDPRLYGEENTKSERVNRDYDDEELRFLSAFLRAGKPVLAVCRGFQLANVFFGGSLYQDLPGHRREETDPHAVTLADGTLLPVNSTHHQAVRRLGEGLEVFATAPDGVIEGFRSADGLLLGVQWHPERLIPGENRTGLFEGAEHPAGLPFFREFAGMLPKD